MYLMYCNKAGKTGCHYNNPEEISLFGCNVGWIPRLLRQSLSGSENESFKWHLSVVDGLAKAGKGDHTLLIDLKPNSDILSLYEVIDVWGVSDSGWTPIMMRLAGLFIEQDRASYNSKDFCRSESDIEAPIFSMTYLNGTVQNGQLVGPWTTPRPSPTNSVLLWPDTFEYFYKEASRIKDF